MHGTFEHRTVAGLGQAVFLRLNTSPACKLSASHIFVASTDSSLNRRNRP